jgi:nucleoside-diphosphate-sugar epimerase
MATKPVVLIFGGLNTVSRTLASFLVPSEGEPLVSHLRIVDKFSVHPPTTYLGTEFPAILQKPGVEYRQTNLTVEANIPATFDPPEGCAPYDYVFDLTGEVRQDRPEQVQINMTCNVARLLGLEAARRKVKAYIRLQHPYYETSAKTIPEESTDIKPQGVIGTWWHEALRILGAIPDLNLTIVRAGFVYGPYVDFGVFPSALAVAAVYAYTKKPMKSLWSPGKHPGHVVHSIDVAGSMWACAQWVASLGRTEANKMAGEEIPFHNDPSMVNQVLGMPSPGTKVVAPLFNIVDDTQNTLLNNYEVITSYFGAEFEFFNLFQSTMFKLVDDIVEEINEMHVSGWVEMLEKSNPPITSSPVSAYMDSYALSKRVYAASNAKIKNIVGYQLQRPLLNQELVGEMVDKWKAEGHWPILDSSTQ